jgi:hypothetical protein
MDTTLLQKGGYPRTARVASLQVISPKFFHANVNRARGRVRYGTTIGPFIDRPWLMHDKIKL